MAPREEYHLWRRLASMLFSAGACLLLWHATAWAQFSPGDLSAAHQNLEGPDNCTRCHEVGKTISGQKCLACHAEIQRTIDAGHGYHFGVRDNACVTCHKEHLGKQASTYRFDSANFDHSKTGYRLMGQHALTRCGDCHKIKNVADPGVAKIAGERTRPTYLGLRSECYACHSNPHEPGLAQKCASCHTENVWTKPKPFDHSTSKFPLKGKHQAVQCRQCHTSLANQPAGGPKIFTVENFSTCESCHKDPHGERFRKQACSSCHTEQGWTAPMQKSFDHAMTGFPLTGKHAAVTCEKCHREAKGGTFAQKYKLPHKVCIDCHEDEHRGEFQRLYNSDCARCHTTSTWAPSTYTIAAHGTTRFALTASHLAVRCQQCHLPVKERRSVFHFERIVCESCHRSVHEQGSGLKADSAKGCQTCHSVESWQSIAYDHSVTTFTLTGAHARLTCTSCHKRAKSGLVTVPFKGLRQECSGCHNDVHNAQFAANGKVACERCHATERWKATIFDHQRQSAFALTGAHKDVPCAKCHKSEQVAGTTVIHYKPLATDCESCHGRSKRS